MPIREKISNYYAFARHNRWYHLFAIFCRVMLALGFIISGIVKIKGERFAEGLPVNNPMGHYLEALFHTGYYYTFVGISQLIIALLLLIPRTTLLGALLYFPVILNICVLAHAVRFEGTRITLFMLLANLFLLLWDYDRLKKMLRVGTEPAQYAEKGKQAMSWKFPFLFAGFVVATMAIIIVVNMFMYDIRPGNAQDECINGCAGNSDPAACSRFCDCIYNEGRNLEDCLAAYEKDKAQHLQKN